MHRNHAAGLAAASLGLLVLFAGAEGQQTAKSAKKAPPQAGPVRRLPDGKPDLEGYWAARTAAPAFDVEDHPVAVYGIPPGKGVVVDPADGKIPYTAAARQKKDDLYQHHMFADPEAHCDLSGVPRQMYAPFGFHLLQPSGYIVLLFEAFNANRVIPLDGRSHIPASVKLYEGDSRGHWEGDVLVVDVTNQNDKTWFDMAGNYHTDKIHVVERFIPVDSNTINYEALIEDPGIYTKPWKMAFPIGRNADPNYETLEFACREGERDLQHYVPTEGGKSPAAKGPLP